jgi:hypothetical protein
MPVPLTSIDLSGAPVGTTGTVDLSRMRVNALPRSAAGPFAHLELVNNSGCDLEFDFPSTGDTWIVPAGRHRVIPVAPGEAAVNWTVVTIFPTAYVQKCRVYYFDFNEQPIDLGQGTAAQVGNQPRNITVPLGVTPQAGNWAPAGAGSTTQIITALLSPANLANNFVAGYVYTFAAQHAAPGGGSYFLEYVLEAMLGDGAGVPIPALGQVTIIQTVGFTTVATAVGEVSSSAGIFYPSSGVSACVQFSSFEPHSPTAGTYIIRLRDITHFGSPHLYWSLLADIDLSNFASPGSTGNFDLSSGTF